MKKGDMEMSSIKLQFVNIYCNDQNRSCGHSKQDQMQNEKKKVINKPKEIKNLTMVSYQLPEKKESNTAEIKIIQQKNN